MLWLLRAGEIAAAILAVTGVLALTRNKVIRPLIATGKRAVALLQELVDAALLIQGLADELRQFSGAFTLFAVGIKDQVDENTLRLDRLEEMRELVVDLQADVQRIDRRHSDGRRSGDHDTPDRRTGDDL